MASEDSYVGKPVPKTMSTQHPDNANLPPFSRSEILEGKAEIREAYYAYSELGCQEVMWDYEGKAVDPGVLTELLNAYPDYFKDHEFGENIFLTYRLPNPGIQIHEKKFVLEALESIPRFYDIAKTFYAKEKITPVFEVILPMTTSAEEIIKIATTYEKITVGKQNIEISDNISLKDWLGPYNPRSINIIPLIESKEAIIDCAKITEAYHKATGKKRLRPFMARSDPALNYGVAAAVLLTRLAISELNKLRQRIDAEIYPILGTGSLPFRGALTPEFISEFLQLYAGYHTFTIQSGLKYDYETEQTKQIVQEINSKSGINQGPVYTHEETEKIKSMIDTFQKHYQPTIEMLTDLINHISKFIPKRRARRLHVGLFGYSRTLKGKTLPRAIKFCGALYAIGIPPEIIGTGRALYELAQKNQLEDFIRFFPYFTKFITLATRYVSWTNIEQLQSNKQINESITRKFGLQQPLTEIELDIHLLTELLNIKIGPRKIHPDKKHELLTQITLITLAQNNSQAITHIITDAAKIRKSLG